MRIFLFFIAFVFHFSALAIDASISFATFKSPTQNYVEVYFTIFGKTIEFEKVDSSNYQAKVEIILLFKQEDKIVQYDKFALNSPLTTQELNFLDLKRYSLENGTYDLEVELIDLVDTTNVNQYTTTLVVDFDDSRLLQSDIQLLSTVRNAQDGDTFVKNGFYFETLPHNFYHKNTPTLICYNEIYNTTKHLKEDFLVSYLIEKMSGTGEAKTSMIRHKRHSPEPINAMLNQIDISTLESGNYRLKIEVRDRNKKLLSQKTTLFQRSNPYLDKAPSEMDDYDVNTTFAAKLTTDDLRYSLKAITPICSDVERLNYAIQSKDPKRQRNYLVDFWRRQNPNEPEKIYEEYMKVVRMVDEKFKSGFGFGFETDRGRIYLKYGQPNDFIKVEDEPDAPPYEIWVYYDLPQLRQTNVKFIFYNPSLAAGDFELLHSNARGELNNPQWQLKLYSDSPTDIEGRNYREATSLMPGINRRAAEYWESL